MESDDGGGAEVLAFPSNGRRNRTEHEAASERSSPRLRVVIGEVLRDERSAQQRTLAEVAADAAVSLPYLSEVERGRKEISSDLLAAVAGALDLTLVEVLERTVDRLRTRAQGDTGIRLLAA